MLVFYQLSQRKCCAASYMMILEYHEKYGRWCNFSRRDRDFCFIILVFRDEIEIRYCYSHVSRRERETQIEFLKVEREKSQSILTRSRENENSRWSLIPMQTFGGELREKICQNGPFYVFEFINRTQEIKQNHLNRSKVHLGTMAYIKRDLGKYVDIFRLIH